VSDRTRRRGSCDPRRGHGDGPGGRGLDRCAHSRGDARTRGHGLRRRDLRPARRRDRVVHDPRCLLHVRRRLVGARLQVRPHAVGPTLDAPWRRHGSRRLGRWHRSRGRPRQGRRRGRLGRGLHGLRLRDRRQEQQRVEVALRVCRPADAQVEVRHRQLRDAARPDRGDRIALGDQRAPSDTQRPEMQQRHRVAVGRLDRQRLAPGRHRAGERDGSSGRRDHRRALRSTDVDPAMLAAFVRVVAEAELAQHRPVHGPCPATRARGREQGRCGRTEQEPSHESTDLLPSLQTEATVAGGRARCQI
jgi:hypothetical protein